MNPFNVFVNYEEAWKDIDHRVDGWLFMSSIWPIFVLIILAFTVVLFGPSYMRTREPLNIGPIMAFLNIFIVIFNVFNACQLWIGGTRKQYSWICQPIDYSATDIEEIRIVKAMHLWFICKLMEMFDSIFLIARKKNMGQTGTLVFHHAFMACLGWIVVRWTPSGSAFVPSFLNSIIHAVIYTYFCLVIFLPRAVETTFIKTAFSCFLVIQHVTYIAYGVIVVWVQCPLTTLFTYLVLALLLGMLMSQLIKFLFDYTRNEAKGGLFSYAINLEMHNADKVIKCD